MAVYSVHPNGDFATLEQALAVVVPGDGILVFTSLPAASVTVNVNNIALYADEHNVPKLSVTLGAGVTEFQTEGSTRFTVLGNSLDNEIHAKAGNEVMIGGAGDDILGFSFFGSAQNFGGTEFASYEFDPAAVSIRLFNNVGFADDGYGDQDTLWGIEHLIGSQFGDTFRGNDLDNTFIGLGGDDLVDGGGGSDTVSYERSTSAGVTVNLATGTAMDAFGGIDTLVNIENITGSEFADSLTGDDGSNELFGAGGDDALDGGDGIDTVTYDSGRSSQLGVNVNLMTGVALDGLGGTDTLANIERVVGSSLDDVLTGSDADEFFVGGRGDDTIDGGGGFDFVSFPVPLTSNPNLVVNLATGMATGGLSGRNTLLNIEGIIGSNSADTLVGNSEDNIFRLGRGDDHIDGGGGFDTVSYEDAIGNVMIIGLERGGHSNVYPSSTGFDLYTSIEKVVGSSSSDLFLSSQHSASMDGGGGDGDTITYIGSVGFSINLDATTGAVHKSNGSVDQLANFEDVTGTNGNDTFVVSYGATQNPQNVNSFTTFHGVGGIDTFDMSGSVVHVPDVIGGVHIDLYGSEVRIAGQEIYEITGIERVIGTSSKDVITGNFANNVLYGKGGDDVINGGEGNDTSVYALAARSYSISFNENSGEYIVKALTGNEGTDTLRNIETLAFNGGATEVAIADALSPVRAVASDFDGDSDDDIVFALNGSGAAVFNGADGSGGGWIGFVGRTVIGTGDFNGDGDADLLFRFADGNHSGFDSGGNGVWLGRSDRKAIGIGDFNGDGDDDVIFQFANGLKHIADADSGNTWVGFADRSIAGVGDFDGDGDDDVLFELNVGGYVTNNVDGTGGRWLGGPNRSVAGIGDFDGDGDDDILFVLNSGGHIINDGQGGGMQWFGFTDRNVAGIGDFDGNGSDDILFKLASGNHTIVSPSGGGRWIARTNANARDIGDFDGDGDDDIVFELAGGGFVVDQADGGAGLGMYFLDRTLVGGDSLGLGLTADAELV